MEDARNLNERIFPQTDQSQWQLVYVHAAVRSWWLAEYSCWYGEQYEGSLTQIQLEEGRSSYQIVVHQLPLTIISRE